MTRLLPPYALASLAALAGLAGGVVLLGGQTFGLGFERLPMAYVLPPLAALALFQLVFGALTGLWRGARFWVWALALCVPVWGAGLVLVLEAWIAPLTGLALVATILMLGGIAALGRTGRRGQA